MSIKFPFNILMIIAPKGFRDEEYFEPRSVFETSGARVTTASSQLGEAIGKLGKTTEINLTLNQVNVEDFEAIIFVGGPGALIFQNDPIAHRIAKKTVEQNKVLAAICLAPIILAKAGVLNNKKATCFGSVNDEYATILATNGAKFTSEDVTVDGKIITGNGPEVARKFGEKVLEVLKKK